MKYLVLGVGYSPHEYESERAEWKKYGVDFDFVDTVQQAIERLPGAEYICVTICADCIERRELDALHRVQPVPVLMLPAQNKGVERLPLVQFSAAQYLRATGRMESAATCSKSIRSYLDLPAEHREPLTIITVNDLCFCLEYRSVEIRGCEIALTAKEFDILTLLIMNQRRVFTYEMLYEQVWNEPSDYFTKKTLITHISTLRKKLRISEDVPDYIKSVHGKGYKFDADQ